MIRLPLFRLFLPVILFTFTVTTASSNVTGIVRGVQENPIAGALVTFTSEANPSLSFSDYTDASGRYDIVITPLSVGDVAPAPFILHQNHPNPFNPTTTIKFSTADAGFVTLAVYNLLGQRVRTLMNGILPAGEHSSVWDGRDDDGTPSGAGVYLYRLAGGGRAEVKKMLLLDGGSVSGWASPVAAAPALKQAAVTWTVTITGEEIEPREITGLEIADGGAYDFYVIFTGELLNFHLVPIPGVTFEMGETWASYGDSLLFGPAHLVTLSDFEISAYETTNSQYAQFMNEALAAGEIELIDGDPCGTGGEWEGKRYIDLDTVLSSGTPVEARCQIVYNNGFFQVEQSVRRDWPVVTVSWYGAKAFAQHYGLDLPTEAEWEYAAGGGTLEYAYATDDGTIDATKANCTLNINHPVMVGSYPPNPLGLYDMSGNIREWCNDWKERYPTLYDDTNNVNDWYSPPSYPLVNPAGPETGYNRVLRGGSYSLPVMRWIECRTTNRDALEPEGTYNSGSGVETLGFRVVRHP